MRGNDEFECQHTLRIPFTYLVAEASYTIESDDISKARDSAVALRKVFPQDTVFACLYCVNITNDLLQRAGDNGVDVFMGEPV